MSEDAASAEKKSGNPGDDTLEALGKRIESIRSAMLVTTDEHGNPWSRPMITREMDENGCLWFFTKRDSEKISHIARDNRVNVAYSKPDDALYLSVTGQAEVVDEMDKKKELWNPFVKAWFPDGLDDPELVLLKITPERAEYWQGPSTQIGRIISIAAKLASGGKISTGKQVEVSL
jgi:general stress protein 26